MVLNSKSVLVFILLYMPFIEHESYERVEILYENHSTFFLATVLLVLYEQHIELTACL